MMRFKLTLVLLLFCAFVKAQTTATITPSHLKAAEDMLTASGAGEQMRAGMDAMIKAAANNAPEDKRVKFTEVMNSFLTKYMNWEILKDQLTAIYAQEFTEKELKDLTTFYISPLGKKLNQKQPALMLKGAAIGQQAVQAHQVELQQMMQEAFKQ
jgi:hypothetical protein